MSRLPAVTGRRMIRFLESLGFQVSRQHGSHIFLRHPDGRTATVPVHAAEVLGRGLQHKILPDAEASRQDFLVWQAKKQS